jgi:hypothetical protein
MDWTATVMGENYEDKQQSKRDSWNDEEVRGNHCRHMVFQECAPGLRGRLPMTDHVFGNRRLGHFEAELQKFSMDAWRSPAGIGHAHFSDKISDLSGNIWAALAMTTLPSPVKAESLSMPRNHGFWFDDQKDRLPPTPQTREPYPEETIEDTEAKTLATTGALQDQ